VSRCTRTLRFATYLAPNMRPVYGCVAEYVGRWLGCPTELVIGESFAAFERGEVDVGFICGLPYVQLMRRDEPPVELLAAPVLQGPRYQGRPIYYSDVIVRRDSPYRAFADLRGCLWAYNDPDSHSGYNITRYTLLRLGETRGFFGRAVEAGFHQEALRMVADGRVDASAIDSQVLAIELRDHPALKEQVHVIDALGPATIQPVVAARHVPDPVKDEVRAALWAIGAEGDDPRVRTQLDYGFVARFVPVTDATYDDIRAMVAAAEAAGFMALS
jgi:phosphonate transport system substrate-binding protein